jgi:hypothetical protein
MGIFRQGEREVSGRESRESYAKDAKEDKIKYQKM